MMRRALVAVVVIAASFAPTAPSVSAEPIPGTTCNLFPSDNIFNTDISSLAVDSHSNGWKNYMTQNAYLHPDLGTVAQQYGMPINVAPPPTPKQESTPPQLEGSSSSNSNVAGPIR